MITNNRAVSVCIAYYYVFYFMPIRHFLSHTLCILNLLLCVMLIITNLFFSCVFIVDDLNINKFADLTCEFTMSKGDLNLLSVFDT